MMSHCQSSNESGLNVTYCESEWGKVEENFLMMKISWKDQCEYFKGIASINLRWKYMNEPQSSLYTPFSQNPYSYKDQLHWALANSVFIMLMSRFWSQFRMSSLPCGSSELQHRHTQESLADLSAPSPTHNAECQAGLLRYQLVSSPQQPEGLPLLLSTHAESKELLYNLHQIHPKSFNDKSDWRLKGLWHVQAAALLSTAIPNKETIHNIVL